VTSKVFTTDKQLEQKKINLHVRFFRGVEGRPAKADKRAELSLRRQSVVTGIFSDAFTLAVTNDEVNGTPSSWVENENHQASQLLFRSRTSNRSVF